MTRALALVLTVAAGCAWGDGDYFTEVDGHLRAGINAGGGIELDRFELHARELVLAAGGDAAEPDGDGHSHRVIAALGPGEAELVGFEVGVIDLVAGVDRALACQDSCGVGTATTIDRVYLALDRVVLAGRAGDIDFALDAGAGGAALEGALAVEVGRDSPEHLELEIELAIDAAIFDGVDLDDAHEVIEAITGLELHAHVHEHH